MTVFADMNLCAGAGGTRDGLGAIEMKYFGASLADGEAAELLAEAAEAYALAEELAKDWFHAQAVADLERYATALETLAR